MKRKYSQKSEDIYFLSRRNKIVERNKNRRAGDYLIGPEIFTGPIESISHYLARKDGTRDFYQLKVSRLSFQLQDSSVFGNRKLMDQPGTALPNISHFLFHFLPDFDPGQERFER